MQIIRILVIAVMAAIVVSLGTALFHLTKGDSSAKLGRALTVRIVLSLVLFLLLMAAWWAGLIKPNGFQN
ncbi:MAG TPA: twin transmembrane helix small protein [Steroidobacteraceae bacterium]|nr:twin transmembrane helix small protein [Steroidobacteraceae bacterium]